MIDIASDTEGGKNRELAITQYKWILNGYSCSQVAEHLIGRPIKLQMLLRVGANQQVQKSDWYKIAKSSI